jgi:hypothetical protein
MKILENQEKFRFEPKDHRYFLGDRELPSVTRILSAAFPWEGPADDFYRDRGTAVHLACELDDLELLDEMSMDDEIWPYLEAWRSFRKTSGFVADPDGIERRRYHSSLFYAGTIDRVGRLRSGRKIVIDIKTGGKYPQYRLQLAGYVNLLEEPLNYFRGSVTLNPDASFSFDEFSREDYPVDLAVFRSCLNIYNFKCQHKLL